MSFETTKSALQISYSAIYDLPEMTSKFASDIEIGLQSKWNYVWLIPANIALLALESALLPLHMLANLIIGIYANCMKDRAEDESEREDFAKLSTFTFHLTNLGFMVPGFLIAKLFNPTLKLEIDESSNRYILDNAVRMPEELNSEFKEPASVSPPHEIAGSEPFNWYAQE